MDIHLVLLGFLLLLLLLYVQPLKGQGNCSGIDLSTPVAASKPGLTLREGSLQARVHLEVFLDPVCRRSTAAYKTMKRLSQHYSIDDVTITIYLVPLPQHRNSYLALQGYYWVEDNKPNAKITYLDTIFSKETYDQLSDENTREMNFFWIRRRLSAITANRIGLPSADLEYDLHNYEESALQAWKYAMQRGVVGAPWYIVNGVVLGEDTTNQMTFDLWREYLDRVLQSL